MGEALEASRVAEGTNANVHWSSTLQKQNQRGWKKTQKSNK